jgi:transketolase
MKTTSLELLCINTIRGLAIDAVQKANSGHPGMPLGAAPVAFALWDRHLRFNPKNPRWFNRDRFVLSAGHGSMLLYALLHLTGYDLPLEEIKQFRQWSSKTPGHPENTLTPGVEMATGPLGQGFSTAVGMAIAERFLSATFNKPSFPLIDHYTYVICSDGDLMEGVSQEAASLAGHLKLGKLIVLYDDNRITIDGSTEQAFTEDTEGKFKALGWHVLRVEGNRVEDVDQAIVQAKKHLEAPTLIICRTTIGYGSPHKAGTAKVHGAPLGPEEAVLTKRALGIPEDKEFWIPDEVLQYFRKAVPRGENLENTWQALFQEYKKAHPEQGALLQSLIEGKLGEAWLHALPSFQEESLATRSASQKILNGIAPHLPTLIGGSADLAESVLTTLKEYSQFQPTTPEGRNIAFGVREHAMMAAVNGITLHGGCKAYGGTFLIFSDYCRPALRLSALMECPSIFVFSHDSVGLGEDGPTHQPIEQIMSLRAIPNFNLMRPADGNETSVCWRIALESHKTPSAILLTRQPLPTITPTNILDHPAHKGAYILREAASTPKVILIGTGSEVHICLGAQEILESQGIPTRVISMPSWFLFERQDQRYKESLLPQETLRVSVEAGATLGWAQYAQAQLGINRFGASAPGSRILQELGFYPESIAHFAKEALKRA